MAIQESVNRILGSVAAGAVGIAKAGEAAAVKQEQGLLAKEQFNEANSSLTELSGESAIAEKAYKEASDAYDAAMAKRPGGKGNTKAAIEEKQKKALTEKEAAERAFKSLQDKIEAKKAMRDRAALIMQRTKIGE